MSSFLFLFLPLLAVPVLLSGCTKSTTGGTDGESHFLKSCDGSCEGNLSCICGVCTASCEDDENCQELSPAAACLDRKASGRCPSGEDGDNGAAGICDVACESSKDCQVLGTAYECRAGSCRIGGDSPQPQGDAGPGQDAEAGMKDAARAACTTDEDCPSNLRCGYAVADECAAEGVCIESNCSDTYCIFFAGMCGCDGQPVFVVKTAPTSSNSSTPFYTSAPFSGTIGPCAWPPLNDAGQAQEDSPTLFPSGWEMVESNTTDTLLRVWGASADDIWAAGANALYHYDGRSWELALADERFSLHGLWGAVSDDIWAVGYIDKEGSESWTALILHYDGTSWKEVELGDVEPIYGGFSGVWGTSAENVYVFQPNETQWLPPWHWDGSTWKELDTEVVFLSRSRDIYSSYANVSGTSPNNIVVADFGGIIRFDGSQWTVIESGLASCCAANAAWALSNRDFLIGKWNWGIERYRGNSPVMEMDVRGLLSDSSFRFGGFWGASDTDIYAIGLRYQPAETAGASARVVASHIYHYDGSTWTEHDLGDLQVALNAIWGSPSGEVWVVGGEGTILRLRTPR